MAKTNPKRLMIIAAITLVSCLLALFIAYWLMINYPRFYCPKGTHKSWYMGRYQCSPDDPGDNPILIN